AMGPKALSDAELVAVLLRTGIRGKSAVDVARDLLAAIGGAGGLFTLTDGRAESVAGLGPAKIAQLRAAFELAQRALRAKLEVGVYLNSPAAVREYLALELRGRPYEVFVVLFLDAQHRVIAMDEIARGTVNQTNVYPREVVRAGITHNATAVILAHNHPSGVAEPSAPDHRLTRALVDALHLVNIQVLDHIVVAGAETLSFAERGLL
ncbi:MAG: DNA repair protein RadC, partial [Burkholderiales bacterium]